MEQIKTIETKHGTFTPIFDFDGYDVDTETYLNLRIIKTAEEVYKEWLESKDKEVDKTKICTNKELQEKVANLEDTLIAISNTLV